VASDVPGVLHHTRNIYFLADGDMAILTLAGVELTDFDGNPIHRAITAFNGTHPGGKGRLQTLHAQGDLGAAAGHNRHYAGPGLAGLGKVYLGEMKIADEELAAASSINIAACGTSWHAAQAGKYMIERLARLPVDVDYASEYRYRNPIPDRNASACSSPSPARPPTPCRPA